MSVLQTIRFSLLTNQLSQIPQGSPAAIERLQCRRLRRLVGLAVGRSAFFRKKYRGIDMARLNLQQLPPLTKDELAANFDSAVTDPRVRQADLEHFVSDPDNLGRWYLGRYAVCHTSGTQGCPLLIVQDRRSVELFFAMMSARANRMGRPGPIEGLRRLRHPARVAIVTLQRGFYPSGSSFEFMPSLVGPYARVLRLSSQQPDVIEQLNAFQPNILVAYASVLEALALQSEHLHLRELRQVANSSEKLTSQARQRIEAAFGTTLLDHYGIGECTFLSAGCPADGGAHINADWAILENVDEHNRPVPAGELGHKVLITNLANTVQPFIRYEVHDRIVLAPTRCGCSSRLPRIDRIEGRAADVFWVRGDSRYFFISGAVFQGVLDTVPEVRQWQAIQHERGRIEVRCELLPNTKFDTDMAQEVVARRFAESDFPRQINLDIRIVPSLPPDARTGKHRRMITELGIPHDLATPVGA